MNFITMKIEVKIVYLVKYFDNFGKTVKIYIKEREKKEMKKK